MMGLQILFAVFVGLLSILQLHTTRTKPLSMALLARIEFTQDNCSEHMPVKSLFGECAE